MLQNHGKLTSLRSWSTKGWIQTKSDSCTFLKKDQMGHVQLAVMVYVDDLVASGNAQMVKEFITMIQEEFTLKHVNFLASENPVEFLGRTIKRNSKMATSQWNSLRSSLMSCSKSLRSQARSQPQDSKFKLFQKIRRLNVTKSFIKNSGQLLENFFGWLSSGMTSSIRSRSFQDHSSIPKIGTSKTSFTCSSMSIRPETSSSSWSLSYQSGIRKASFRFRLSAIQIQIGQVVKNQGSQQVAVHWCQYSMSIFSQQAELRLQLLTSSAESELYAMTQAAVESLAIKNFIQEFSSAILSSSVSIVIQTDSSAGKSMASRLGMSRHSKHIELKYLWIQDEVKEGKLELKKVGTHFNPSDVLTKYVPASVLGQHLPRLNIFKVNSQRSAKSVQHSAKQVQYSSHPQPPSTSSIMHDDVVSLHVLLQQL